MKTKILLGICLSLVVGILPSPASAPFMPLHVPPAGSTPVAAPIVDEPLGARSSLGLTLWHLGHDADAIAEFHRFLEKQSIKPESLLPTGLKAPDNARRMLLEPERLPEEKLNGWKAQNEYVTSWAGDAGPSFDMPLRVDRAGLYRGWVRFHGSLTGASVTGLRIYRAGREAEGPIVNDEIYDYATETEGPNWKSFMVDLLPGEYTVRLSHVTRAWHTGKGPANYITRQIDLLYFTDEIWQGQPSNETLQALRETSPNDVQTSAQPNLSDQAKTQWLRWQIRPLSWEDALTQPRLFALSREYWRQGIEEIGKRDYGTEVPDYRTPERQIIFDDGWNLVANPVQVRRRIETLKSDLVNEPLPHFWHWVNTNDFQKIEGDWAKGEAGIVGHYGDFGGLAEHILDVNEPGEYSVWVRYFNLPGYFAPWRLVAESEHGAKITLDHDQKEYPAEWQKAGVLKLGKAGQVRLQITPLILKESPATYKRIYDVLLTTDPNYEPKGNVRPPTNMAQFRAKARSFGAKDSDALLTWISRDTYAPPSQEVWDDNSWPAPLEAGQTAPPMQRSLALPQNARRSVQVGLRNLRATPMTLNVSGGTLRGANGTVPDRISWRVVGYIPRGESSRDWSPFLLMRRPNVTVPPHGAASVWLTIDTNGVAPGQYSSELIFEGEGVPRRTVNLQVDVRPEVSPQQPILISGWTQPPEGEIYKRDFTLHGLNVWHGEMSKAEMQERGIYLLAHQIWTDDEAEIRTIIARFKALGLEYSDWVFYIMDEPHGKNEEELKPFLDIAKAIKRVDSNARILFNPGESATAATFETLDPYADIWLPFIVHKDYADEGGDGARRRAVFQAKPWLWYTTPDLYDQRPGYPREIYVQVRSVPAQPGEILGTAFFAFYYPFRDAWDLGHEFLPDAGVTVLPSRHGPVATRQWEAIAEASVHANLAQAVKENAAPGDAAAQKLIAEGSMEQLLEVFK